jgi:hypothetical protein
METDNSVILKLLINVVIPLITLLFGLYAENRWNLINKIKINRKHKTHQSIKNQQSTRAANIQVGGDNFGPISQTLSDIHGRKNLSPGREYIITCITKLQKYYEVNSAFEEKYRQSMEYLGADQPRLAASECYSACLEVKEILLDKNTYKEGVNQNARIDIESFINDLDRYVRTSSSDISKLNEILYKFEDAFFKLGPYIIYEPN